MLDILNIPLYYISFKPLPQLEQKLKNVGFTKITHFVAVDGRKSTPINLLKNNTITIRSYHDLILGREQHTGMPGLGAIGCTLSHYELWKLCVKNDLPYIIIVEDDVKIASISKTHKHKIAKILQKKNSVFLGTSVEKDGITRAHGTHFCIISNNAARLLIKYALPIDVQTDHYICHLDSIGLVNLQGIPIAKQAFHFSTTHTNKSIKTYLPINNSFYILFAIFVLFLLYCISKKLCYIVLTLTVVYLLFKNGYSAIVD